VIIDRDAYGPGEHRFHAGFRDFAKHHGFRPRMCAPYRAQTKGKVERFNRYLKESFVWPLESRLKPLGFRLDAATANAEVGAWLRDVANVRIHGETRERGVLRNADVKLLFCRDRTFRAFGAWPR
jgi:transposase